MSSDREDDVHPGAAIIGHVEDQPNAGVYTTVGMIEGLGRFASGARNVRGWRRTVATSMAVMVLLLFLAGPIGLLVSLASRLFN